MRAVVWLFLTVPPFAYGQVELKENLPRWAADRLVLAAQQFQLEPSNDINPFLQRGDFDGDGKPDVAILVRRKIDRKTGILILQRSGKQALLGAGHEFGNGGDDFNWLDAWSVEENSALQQSFPSLKVGADVLVLSKEGSASGLVTYIDGHFHWEQQGD